MNVKNFKYFVLPEITTCYILKKHTPDVQAMITLYWHDLFINSIKWKICGFENNSKNPSSTEIKWRYCIKNITKIFINSAYIMGLVTQVNRLCP